MATITGKFHQVGGFGGRLELVNFVNYVSKFKIKKILGGRGGWLGGGGGGGYSK